MFDFHKILKVELEYCFENSRVLIAGKKNGWYNYSWEKWTIWCAEIGGKISMKKDEAYLSSDQTYSIFKYDDYVIRFLAPYSLERYTKVKEWNNGYLVVLAKYEHNSVEEEEYIDLVPILNNLYFDANEFLRPIKKVRILYDWYYANSRLRRYDY